MANSEDIALVVDTRGLNCPLPVLRARKAIKKLPAGSLVRIDCTDPLVEVDIPHMAHSDGHQLLSKGREDGIYWFVLKV